MFKDISYLEAWQPLHSQKLFEFGPLVQEMLFKDFLSRALLGPHVQQSRTICAILVEDIMGSIHMKYSKFEPVVQVEMSFKEKVYGRTTDKLIKIAHLELSAQVS